MQLSYFQTELADVDEWSNMPLGRHGYKVKKSVEKIENQTSKIEATTVEDRMNTNNSEHDQEENDEDDLR